MDLTKLQIFLINVIKCETIGKFIDKSSIDIYEGEKLSSTPVSALTIHHCTISVKISLIG